MVERLRRECRRIAAGKADPSSLVDRLWFLFSFAPSVDARAIPRLWAFVPDIARDTLVAALREAASPQFRLPLWIREYQPMTLEELEADAEQRSSKVRLWAAAVCRFLDASAPERKQQ